MGGGSLCCRRRAWTAESRSRGKPHCCGIAMPTPCPFVAQLGVDSSAGSCWWDSCEACEGKPRLADWANSPDSAVNLAPLGLTSGLARRAAWLVVLHGPLPLCLPPSLLAVRPWPGSDAAEAHRPAARPLPFSPDGGEPICRASRALGGAHGEMNESS